MKIALYVRVSREEMESSLINQKEYIKSLYPNDEVIIYQDFVISGTKISNREGFIQMLLDAGLKQHFITKKKFVFVADDTKKPLFDKIVTKSVTRFARNTDVLMIWKELKQKGVTVLFQDINKDTASTEDSLILNLLLTLSQEESKNISERTKFGNMATAKANKIRNNGLYGYHYIKETNSLVINETEAEVVRKMFDLCIKGYGYDRISQALAEEGVLNAKGKPFAISTIKNLIHNKKYCGYNVRNQWESRNLFSENHSHCRTKKEKWIIQKNDRIEPIISEEVWNQAMAEVNRRLLHGNSGKHIDRRDTSDKLICSCCGKNFYICHSKKIGSGINSYPYFICSTKKKKGKNECDNDNVQVRKVDAFIDSLCKNYYKNIRLSNKAKLYKLQTDLKALKNKSTITINNEIQSIREQNSEQEQKLDKLIDNFLGSSEVMKKVVDKKIHKLEMSIQHNNNRILELERSKNTIDSDKLELEKSIRELKKELAKLDTVELTREQLMKKISCIKVAKGNNFTVEYL